jgi:tetratricopeptide (TPR) repeat protein
LVCKEGCVVREHDTRFLAEIGPLLEHGSFEPLLSRLLENWPVRRLVEMLDSPLAEVVRVAAQCLGMVGNPTCCKPLVRALEHESEAVRRTAEDSLWNVWMRAGSDAGVARLAEGIGALREDRVQDAAALLAGLCAEEPEFAEAHHQFALALHTLDRLEEAETEYSQAVQLNPYHFAALAGLGHVAAQLGDYPAALRFYELGLAVNPDMPEIREVVPALRSAVQHAAVA